MGNDGSGVVPHLSLFGVVLPPTKYKRPRKPLSITTGLREVFRENRKIFD